MTRTVSSRWLGGDAESPSAAATEAVGQVVDLNAVLLPKRSEAGGQVSRVDRHWDQVSGSWDVYETPSLAQLVVPTGNARAPFHRWFHLKEGYSKELLPSLVNHLGLGGPEVELTLADPFSGVGTTLLSAVDMVRGGSLASVRGYGLEVNPFLEFVASAKLEAATALAEGTKLDSRRIVAVAAEAEVDQASLPALSTFQKDSYFPRSHVFQLVQLRRAIEAAGLADDERLLARMAFAMTVEPASRLRRDGRTLRYEDREPLQPFDVFGRAVDRLLEDLGDPVRNATAEIVLASAASPRWKSVPDGAVDLVLFSPPYPNNIDYTEVYKTELWAMGFVEDQAQFRAQRHATLRSHPSVKFTRPLAYRDDPRCEEIASLVAPLVESIAPESRYALALKRMVEGYADDMLKTFDAAWAALRPGGYCVYVVGNSVHGGKGSPLMIASDVLLGGLAEQAGFEVDGLHIARRLPRRRIESDYVRESMVVLRKP